MIPIDISIPVDFEKTITAWYLEKASFNIVKDGSFIGSVEEGGNVNFRDFISISHVTVHIQNVVDILQKNTFYQSTTK